jgi:hypothetical protein
MGIHPKNQPTGQRCLGVEIPHQGRDAPKNVLRRRIPKREGSLEASGVCDLEHQPRHRTLSKRSPSASDIGCNCAGSRTRQASMASHFDTSMPARWAVLRWNMLACINKLRIGRIAVLIEVRNLIEPAHCRRAQICVFAGRLVGSEFGPNSQDLPADAATATVQ